MANVGSRQNVYVSTPPQQQHVETGFQLIGSRVHHANHTNRTPILLQSAVGGTLARTRNEILVSAGNGSSAWPIQSNGALRNRMVNRAVIHTFDVLSRCIIRRFFFFCSYLQPKWIHLFGLSPEGERLGGTPNG